MQNERELSVNAPSFEFVDVFSPEQIEQKRHELWGNLVREFAPSYTSIDPTFVLVLPMIPTSGNIEDTRVSEGQTRIDQDMRAHPHYETQFTDGEVGFGAVANRVASASEPDSQATTELQTAFLRSPLEILAGKTTQLGIHDPKVQKDKGGVIFLPENIAESRAWAIFVELRKIVAEEGIQLLIRYFPKTMEALSADLVSNKNNELAMVLRSFNRNKGVERLLKSHYFNANERSQRTQALSTTLLNVCSQSTTGAERFQAEGSLADIIKSNALPIIPHIDQENLSNGESGVAAAVNKAAKTLQYSYDTVSSFVYKAVGLHLAAKELHAAYPHDYAKALRILSATMYLQDLDQEPRTEARKKTQNINPIVSRATLQILRTELRELMAKPVIQGDYSSMADSIVSHEFFHGLLSAMSLVEGGRKVRNLEDEEYTAESVNMLLGYKDAVKKRTYYYKNKGEIERKEALLTSLSPNQREQLLRQYLSNPNVI